VEWSFDFLSGWCLGKRCFVLGESPRLFRASVHQSLSIDNMSFWVDGAWAWDFRWRRGLFVLEAGVSGWVIGCGGREVAIERSRFLVLESLFKRGVPGLVCIWLSRMILWGKVVGCQSYPIFWCEFWGVWTF